MSYRKAILKDIGVLFSEKTVSIAMGFFTTFLAYRLLSPAGYGAVGVLESLFALSTSLVAFRTTESLTRCLIEFRKRELSVSSLIRISLTIDLATQCIALILSAIAIAIIPSYFERLHVTPELVALLAIGNLLTFPQNSFMSLIREKRSFGYLAMSSLTSKALLLIGLVVLFLLGISSIRAYLAVLIISRLCNFVFIASYIHEYQNGQRNSISSWVSKARRAFLNPFLFWRDSAYEEYWYFLKMGFFTSTLSGLVKNGSDMILIGHFGDASDVGHYKLAKSLAQKVQLAPSLLAPYFFQDFSEWTSQKNFSKLRSFLKQTVLYWTPSVMLVCFLTFLASKPLILLCFEEESLPAVTHFRILLAGMSIQIALFWVQPLVLSLKLLRAQLLGVFFVTTGYFAIIFSTEPRIGVYSISTGLAFAWGGGYLYLLMTLYRMRGSLMVSENESSKAVEC